MTLDLANLRKLALAATPGEWYIDRCTDGRPVGGIWSRSEGKHMQMRDTRIVETDDGFYPPTEPDAELIVAMRNNILELISLAEIGQTPMSQREAPHCGSCSCGVANR